MKGLELCQRFFHEVGLPAIRQRLPECLPHLAAGMAGGSQCHGNDDEVSRDHAWGPGFAVWLVGPAHDRFTAPLQDVLDELPREFLGHVWQTQPARTCTVYEISDYIKSVVGCQAPPESDLDWLHIPEESLFELTHRPVFYDATGEVTERFASFARYPEDIWKKRLSANLAWLWEWGIKHLPRAERRGDTITAATYWCKFATRSMKVAFLLSRHYGPYHKWLYREFLKLPGASRPTAPLLEQGFGQTQERADLASRIVRTHIRRLADLGYGPVTAAPCRHHTRAYMHTELLDYARAVRQDIENPQVGELSIWVEILPPPTRPTSAQIFPSQA